MRDRVILITGSTHGLGRELARACVAHGAKVIVHGRGPTTLPGATALAVELATPDGPDTLIREALAIHGRIDVLVNNAAVSPPRAPLWELERATIDDALAVDLRAPLLAARALLAWAVPRGEHVRIVNVSSGITALPRDRATAYTATKAALEGFTRALALDVGDRATVTAVALGGHRTALAARVLDDAELAGLPEPAAAVPALLHAITADRDVVCGRVLGDRDPVLDVAALDLLAHPFGPSPRARAALAEVATAGPLDRYPEREHAPLAKLLAAEHGVPLDAIVLGGGTGELLERVLRVAARPGEGVVAHAPSWPLLPHACRVAQLAWRRVGYRIAGDRVDPALDDVRAAIDHGVRVVYLTSPSNPGGCALDAAPFARFLAGVPPHVTVIVDEAYAGFATRDDALDAARCVAWSEQLIVLRSFSKLHGLAGLRVGYAIAARERAAALRRAAPAFPLVRGATEAALAAVADHAHVRRVVAGVVAARQRLEARLDQRRLARLASDAPFVLAADPSAPGPRVFDRYVMLPAWAESV